ncbi:hypothetical protein ACKWTF_008308 [Chironomus riparius]
MDLPFELAIEAVEGLNFLNDAIDEEITRKVIVNAVKQILVNGPALPARSDIYENDVKLNVKKAEYGISCTLICSARNGIDSLQLKEVLSFYKVNKKTTSQLMESYEKFKDDLTNKMMKFGSSHKIETLTDVDYEIQQQYIPNGDILFKLTLKSFDHEKGENKIIDEIYCNQEELQLLIAKLKDIERHCERISKLE